MSESADKSKSRQREEELKKREELLDQQWKKLYREKDELEERKYSLVEQENDLKSQKKGLARATNEVEERKQRIEKREESLREQGRELEQKSADLDRRAREVERREQEVQDDFQAMRLREEKALREEMAELHEEMKAQLDEEIEGERQRRRENLVADLEQRREEVYEDLEQHRKEVREALEERREEVDKLLEERTKELDARAEELDKTAEQLEKRRDTLAKEKLKLKEREDQLDIRRSKLDAEEGFVEQQKQRLDEEADERAAEKVAKLKDRLDQRQERIEGLQEELGLLQKRLDSHEDWRRRFGEREPDEVLDRLRQLEKQLDEKREELRKRPTPEQKERLDVLEKMRTGWEKQRQKLTTELNEARTQLNDHVREHGLAEQQRDLYEAEKRRRETLNATVEGLEGEIKRLKGIYEKPTERKARIGSIEQPMESLTKRLTNRRASAELDELRWLNVIDEKCDEIDFKLPRRLLHAFHTALKTAAASPITVLAGVSGTGKSMLPRVYSHFGGLQFLDVPVRPDWDSPQSLFGFFNSIDNQFNSTQLLRAMVQASESPQDEEFDGGFNDRMMLVLLDEMNLAHVELYFSDLLSKLESRRSSKAERISIDLGAGVDDYELELTDNVLWTGTMNQDATTKSLSDKVVDRSNVIFFPRPDEFIRRFNNDLGDPEALLHKDTWEQWKADDDPFSDEEIEDFKAGLELVNGRLEKVGRALGHRVWQSVEQYMLNYPTVIEARQQLAAAEDEGETSDEGEQIQKDTEKFDRAMKEAFEDQVVQKVMPKLRGIETRGEARKECLEPIREILVDDLELGLERDFDIACETGQGRFVWNSAHYVTSD